MYFPVPGQGSSSKTSLRTSTEQELRWLHLQSSRVRKCHPAERPYSDFQILRRITSWESGEHDDPARIAISRCTSTILFFSRKSSSVFYILSNKIIYIWNHNFTLLTCIKFWKIVSHWYCLSLCLLNLLLYSFNLRILQVQKRHKISVSNDPKYCYNTQGTVSCISNE